ncbi:MAG: beta strand repeat-containing protein, partial [Planctomycetota bacterium]
QAAGAITFASTLDGAFSATVNTQGITTFGGAVGGQAALTSLVTDAGGTTRINGGSVTTTGSQTYNDAATLGANTTLSGSAITFATTLDGAFALAANSQGTTTFGGVVGGTTPLVSLATDAGGTTALNGGDVTTTGAAGQSYGDAVVLGTTARLHAGSGAISFAGTVDGAARLVANTSGTTTFGGAVGSTTPLLSLATDAGGATVINGGSVTTTGNAGQVYGDAVVLGANTTLAAGTRAITFASTLDGGFAATLRTSGLTTFGGAVGGTTALANLYVNAGGTTAINGGSVTTTGNQTYGDAVTLGADTTLTGVDVRFASTVDGGSALVVNASGATSFDAAVGATTPLASITTDAAGTTSIGGGSVRTTGSQTWLDNVVLTADTAFTSTGGSINAGPANTFQAPGRDVSFTAATGIGSAAAPIRIAAAEVTALVTGSGDIHIVGIGDLVIGSGGLGTVGSIAIDASGQIRVPDGGWIAAGGGVTAGRPVRWSVLGTADAGPGSLRQVISNANVSGVEGVVVFTGASNVFRLGSDLPAISTRLTVDGTGAGVVLDGGRTATDGLSFWGSGSAGSTLRAVTLRNFNGAGVVLDASAGTLVQGVVVQASGTGLRAAGNLAGASLVGSTFTGNRGYGIALLGAAGLLVDGNSVTSINTATSMGLYATGESAGTRVVSNVFRGGLRGALLDGAKRLVFGEIGRGNRLIGAASVPGSEFAGTGIRAQGDLAGTTVRSNVFTGNNYGMAFVNAQGLTFGGATLAEANRINTSRITGVLVVGDNTGSQQLRTVFGTGVNRNRVNITRARGSRGA